MRKNAILSGEKERRACRQCAATTKGAALARHPDFYECIKYCRRK